MKKLISVLLSMCMLLSLTLTACAAEETQTESETTIILKIGSPAMTVNGKNIPIDEQGTVPVIVNGRTLLPVRAVVEQMGGTVAWNGETQEVTLTYGKDEIKLTIDRPSAMLNGEEKTLDVAPTVMNDRTMLPIRFIAESFKFSVLWDDKAQTVTISKIADETESHKKHWLSIIPQQEPPKRSQAILKMPQMLIFSKLNPSMSIQAQTLIGQIHQAVSMQSTMTNQSVILNLKIRKFRIGLNMTRCLSVILSGGALRLGP